MIYKHEEQKGRGSKTAAPFLGRDGKRKRMALPITAKCSQLEG